MAEMVGVWTEEQNDAIVADYFAMLADDIAGRPYSKAGHSRHQERLVNDFAELRTDFDHAFVKLTRRAFWHRVVFIGVGVIGIAGAGFAKWVGTKLISIDLATCL